MRTVARWLALLLIFMVPWEDTVTIGTFGSLARLMGVAVAGFWALTVLARGRMRRLQPFHAALALFVLWNMASLFWTFDLAVTQMRIKTYVQLCLFALVLWDQFPTDDSLRAGEQAYVLGCWVCVFSSVANYRAGVQSEIYAGGRYTATGVNAVELAVFLALALPFAWHLAIAAQNGPAYRSIVRLANFAYLPAGSFAIFLTGSRTALFAVAPAVLYMLWSVPRLRLASRLLVLAALAAVAVTLESLVPQSTLARLGTVGTSIGSADLGGRVYLWRLALAEFFSHPLGGIGSGGFSSTSMAGTWVHNTFLSVLTETGIVGFILFAAILTFAIYHVLCQPKQSARLWGSVLAIWAMGALSLTWEFRKVTWLILTLVVSSATLPAILARRRNYAEETPIVAGLDLPGVAAGPGSARPDGLGRGDAPRGPRGIHQAGSGS